MSLRSWLIESKPGMGYPLQQESGVKRLYLECGMPTWYRRREVQGDPCGTIWEVHPGVGGRPNIGTVSVPSMVQDSSCDVELGERHIPWGAIVE